MRIVFFSFLFLFTATTAMAQDNKLTSQSQEVTVETKRFPTTTVKASNHLLYASNKTAGIFVLKNSRVKRALSFKVKTRNPKLA